MRHTFSVGTQAVMFFLTDFGEMRLGRTGLEILRKRLGFDGLEGGIGMGLTDLGEMVLD